jgi:hypothetical protein
MDVVLPGRAAGLDRRVPHHKFASVCLSTTPKHPGAPAIHIITTCRNDHPDLQDAGSSSSSSARASPISPQPDGPQEALVRQPQQQLLLGLLIDSLWPPRASKDNYVKGQVRRCSTAKG